MQTVNHLDRKGIIYTYDELAQLVSATGGIEPEYKCPDAVGNLYETPERKDRTYSSGGRLERDKNWYYYYDTKGNLQLKSPYPLHGKDPSKKWQMGCWHYEWYANGMLKSVQKPSGSIVSFEYDALGRRIAKIFKDTITRYVWDGNVLLHEWKYNLNLRPQLVVGDLGELYYDRKEPTKNTTTWVYEEGHVPISKIVNGEQYSIISDYIGRPIQVFNNVGKIVWETEYDIYGRLKNLKGDREFQPFRQVGQFEDVELEGLYYNRYRFYESSTGLYISQDPIKLLSGELNLYSYVHDNNSWLDILGLTGTYMFTDGKTWYIGKGPEDRMYASMKERVGGKANVTQGIHVDYLDNNKGLMVEAELMRRKDAVNDSSFKNAINSPGEKMLADAEKNNKALYDDIVKKADDFESKFNNTKGIKCH